MLLKNKIFLTLVIILALFTRFSYLDNFYSETDDQLSISQLLKYDEFDLYEIANDNNSETYNSTLKKNIRKIQNLDNKYIDIFQKYFSKFLFNMAPSKHSTFAPLQYSLFGWIINNDQSYKELKFYSRLPSAIFSFLTIILVFLISKKIFSNELLYILPTLITATSLPLIFISQRSYNYSAGSFAMLVLLLIFLIQYDKKNHFFINEEINLKFNLFLAVIFTLLAYLNYMMILFVPLFYLVFFIFNYLDEKKIFSKFNINLTISGLIYTILILPLILYMLKLDLNEYGMTASTSGEFGEYSISQFKSEGFLDIFLFYIKNIYLIITRNLSFFLDSANFSYIIQFIIFLIFILGAIKSFSPYTNPKLKFFNILVVILFFYWCLLSFFNITALGPTRHLNIFTGPFIIILTFGLSFFLNKFFKNKIIFDNILTGIFFFILTIFIYSLNDLKIYYTDLFSEKKFNKIITEYKVGYIINDGTLSDALCLMKTIKITRSICSEGLKRYNYSTNIKSSELIKQKKNGQSIALVNILDEDIYSKKVNKKNKIIKKLLKESGFSLFQSFKEIRFMTDSPLYISKYKPNFLIVELYK